MTTPNGCPSLGSRRGLPSFYRRARVHRRGPSADRALHARARAGRRCGLGRRPGAQHDHGDDRPAHGPRDGAPHAGDEPLSAPALDKPEVDVSTDLAIGGMTCGACANRIERKLNKVDGVTATVNYATEKAAVTHPGTLTPADLIAVIEAAGYTAELPPDPAEQADDEGPDEVLREHRSRLLICAVLAVPVVLTAMVPALQFPYWQWVSLALTLPVVVWGAEPFHRAAWTNLRHGNASMDTLVSIGSLAAFGWSVYALFFGGAGYPGFTHTFHFALAWSD